MFIDYTATRELVGSGLDEIEASASIENPDMRSEGADFSSMSGVNRESTLHRLEFVIAVTTVPITTATKDRWREFAASVGNGETFTFDAYGTKAAPDNPITVSMVRNSYKQQRLGGQYVQYSFEVLER